MIAALIDTSIFVDWQRGAPEALAGISPGRS
jgi:hypothetical protein